MLSQRSSLHNPARAARDERAREHAAVSADVGVVGELAPAELCGRALFADELIEEAGGHFVGWAGSPRLTIARAPRAARPDPPPRSDDARPESARS